MPLSAFDRMHGKVRSKINKDGMIDERLAVLRYRIPNKEAMERHGMNLAAALKLEGLKQEGT